MIDVDDYDHEDLDDNDHLIDDWFEQDVQFGVVSQRCVVVVRKVCWLPVS